MAEWPDREDPYWRLRPEPATPQRDLCSCSDEPPVVLQDHLSSVPLACLRCNGETLPERIGFSAELSETIAFWTHFHRAFYTLWLDSGEYEGWALAQFSDSASPVNERGLAIVGELNAHRRAYYWWFQDVSADGFRPLSQCPICGLELTQAYGRDVCEPCSIVVPNG